MNDKRLFRQEVLDKKRNQNYGSVFINTPAKYMAMSIGFSFVVASVFLFILFAEFSEKFIVNGYLESTKGLARVYPKRNGVIVKQFVHLGDEVKKGDKLFLIDTSDEGIDIKKQQNLLAKLENKKKSILNEMAYKKRYLDELKGLLERKFISLSTYHEKHDEIVALEQQKNAVDVEIIHYKNDQSYLIHSPVDGVVSSLVYQEGQYTNLTKPLLKILPSHDHLMAALFIPVRHSGFLNHNNQVIIRYDAYPNSRFGSSIATIKDISRSIMTDEEEDKPIRIREPYYRVTAALNQQVVSVYGVSKKIQQGMTVSAVIVGSKRKIWQWILDPLYSFYGGIVI